MTELVNEPIDFKIFNGKFYFKNEKEEQIFFLKRINDLVKDDKEKTTLIEQLSDYFSRVNNGDRRFYEVTEWKRIISGITKR